MIRLTVVLCGALFVALLIAGEDKGQVRQGLMANPTTAEARAAAPVVTKAPAPDAQPVAAVSDKAQITEAVFVPVQPVRLEPAAPVPLVSASAADQPAAQTEESIAVVTARSANVRSGPSTADAVIGRLTEGEEVLVVVAENPTEGWSLVRIEGDGITGFVATRLLRPVAP